MNISRENPDVIQIGQKCRTLYTTTYARLVIPFLGVKWYQVVRIAEEVQAIRDCAVVLRHKYIVYLFRYYCL